MKPIDKTPDWGALLSRISALRFLALLKPLEMA